LRSNCLNTNQGLTPFSSPYLDWLRLALLGAAGIPGLKQPGINHFVIIERLVWKSEPN